jgi:hypothetical protein
MSPLSRLENAVLEKILSQAASNRLPLQEQLDGAFALNRQNTGAGFYTKLETPYRSKLIDIRIIGNVFAHIGGLNHPMTFLLFTKSGLIETLEGASVDEDTRGIDFANVQFEMIEESNKRTSL